MRFGIVQPRTEADEIELNININGRLEPDGIISKIHYEKVKFTGFIEGETVEECRNKIIKLNTKYNKNYRLYGLPFSNKGEILSI